MQVCKRFKDKSPWKEVLIHTSLEVVKKKLEVDH